MKPLWTTCASFGEEWERSEEGHYRKIKKNCKEYRGSRNIAQFILNFDTVWRWIVNSTFRPFYPQERTPASKEWEVPWAPEAVSMFQEKTERERERDSYCPYWLSTCTNQYRRKLWNQLLADRNSLDHRRIFVTALIQIPSSSREFKMKTTLLTDLWFQQNASVYKGGTEI